MAISTYTELQTAVANWLNRSDLTSRIPEFISLGEARINRDVRTRMQETNGSLTTTASSRTVSLPSDFVEPLALLIELTSGREEITFSPSKMETSSTSGEPQYWTIDGANIAFERPADQTYTLTLKYLKKWDVANDTAPQWLLTNYPDLYLSAALAEGLGYLMDDQAIRWVARYNQTIEEINRKEGRNRSQSKLRTDLVGVLGQRTWDINRGF